MNFLVTSAFLSFIRNNCWGTCVDCPRDSNLIPYPEFCVNTKRADHHLSLDALVELYRLQGYNEIE